MKKILLVMLLCVFSVTTVHALESPWEKKLPLKNATIDYKVTGTQKGKKTVYIKDYGKTTAEYRDTTMTVMGMKQLTNEATITTPDWQYDLDLQSKTGTKITNPQKYLIEEFKKLPKSKQKKVIKNVDEMGLATVEGMEGEFVKNATQILGYKCDKMSMMGATAYTISGTDLLLKSEASIMGMTINEVATKIKKGSVSSSKFKVPSDIRVSYDAESDRIMKENAKMIMESLVSGKAPSPSSMPQRSAENNDQTEDQDTVNQMKEMMQQMFGGQE